MIVSTVYTLAVKRYCGGLMPPPPYTTPLSGNYSVGEVIQLECVEGYRATGQMDITCTRQLSWTTPTASCQRKNTSMYMYNATITVE